MTEKPTAEVTPDCDHHYVSYFDGGPISVGVCQFCHQPDWADLAKRAAALYTWGREEALAGKPARSHLSARDMPRDDDSAATSPAPVDGDARLADRAVLAECDAIEADYRDQHDDVAVGARAAVMRIRTRAVLPAPAGRATVLREAAAWYEGRLANATPEQDPRYWTAVRDMTLGLRRMADEAQQAPTDADVVKAHELALHAATDEADEAQQTEAAESLVHVGWWCWRCNNLTTTACRSDNVPIHVPTQWADDMQAVIQRITDGDDEAPTNPVCQGFQWIGQPFTTCDGCGQPAWDHVGEDVPVDRDDPFNAERTVRPWKPGEADAMRAKWEPPAT